MRVLPHLALWLCVGLLAGSCGGGGSTPMGPVSTTTITIGVGNDGDSNGVTTELSDPFLTVGDDLVANVWRGMLLFPLDTVPAGATVVDAVLNISFGTKSGSPAANLGNLRFVRYQGVLGVSNAGYIGQELSHDPGSDILVDIENQRVQVNVRQLVTSAVGSDSALGIRIQYFGATAGPLADNVTIASGNNADSTMRPVLDIVIEN